MIRGSVGVVKRLLKEDTLYIDFRILLRVPFSVQWLYWCLILIYKSGA